MKVRRLGEFGLIDLIKEMVESSPGIIKGIGEDCAVLPFNLQNFLLLTCDMLVEDVDFTLKDKPYLIGGKSIRCCLSDIAACGGLPRFAQISLGLSPGIEIPISQMIHQIQKTVPGAQIATIRKIKYPKGLTPQIAEMEGNGIRNRVLGNILGDGLSESEFDSLIQALRESHRVVEIESVVSVEKSHIRILGQTEGPFKEIYEILTLNI